MEIQDSEVKRVLDFWFGEEFESNPTANSSFWWSKDESFDRSIWESFGELHRQVVSGENQIWINESLPCLAYIITIDQFSRNMFRGGPRSFANDSMAREACHQGIREGIDQDLHVIHRWFFYMPLMHSEQIADQDLCVQIFDRLRRSAPPAFEKEMNGAYEFAVRHRDIVAAYGRFPHRNEILGRQSTPQEVEFLKKPGSSF